MDNRNNNNDNDAAAAAAEAALYDANISVTALQQQLFVSEAATLRALQLAEARANEAELQYATEIVLREQVRQLRVEVREAEARRMPPAPRPQHARLVGPVSAGSTTMRDEILVLRAENQALREQLLRERAVGLAVRFVFEVSLSAVYCYYWLCDCREELEMELREG
jgi:hypothetical protein